MFTRTASAWQRSIRPYAIAACEVAVRLPATIGLTLVAAVLYGSPTATEFAQFDRAAIRSGQLWRVSTGHIVHWSVDHLVWDLAAFFVLAAYCEARGRRRFVMALLLAETTIVAGLWWLRPDVRLYRGLSGIDSMLFVWAAGMYGLEARSRGDRTAVVIATAAGAAFLGKTGYETLSGATLFVDSAGAGFEPLVMTHLLGAFTAVAMTAATVLGRRSARCRTRRGGVRAGLADVARSSCASG